MLTIYGTDEGTYECIESFPTRFIPGNVPQITSSYTDSTATLNGTGITFGE